MLQSPRFQKSPKLLFRDRYYIQIIILSWVIIERSRDTKIDRNGLQSKMKNLPLITFTLES